MLLKTQSHRYVLLPLFPTRQQKSGKATSAYDPFRTLRMFGFGFCWYGPYQYYW